MTIDLTTLDAHEQPSDELRGKWKGYSRTDHTKFINHPDIDEAYDSKDNGSFKLAGHIPSDKLFESFKHLEGPNWQPDQEIQDVPIYFHPLLPGMSNPFSYRNIWRLVSNCVSRSAHYAFNNSTKHTEGLAISDDTQRPEQSYPQD